MFTDTDYQAPKIYEQIPTKSGTRLQVFSIPVRDFIDELNDEKNKPIIDTNQNSQSQDSIIRTIGNIAYYGLEILASSSNRPHRRNVTQIGLSNTVNEVHVHVPEEEATQKRKAEAQRKATIVIGGFISAVCGAFFSAKYTSVIQESNENINTLQSKKREFNLTSSSLLTDESTNKINTLIDSKLQISKNRKSVAMRKIVLSTTGLVSGLGLFAGFVAPTLITPAALILGFTAIGALFNGFCGYFDCSEKNLTKKADDALVFLNKKRTEQKANLEALENQLPPPPQSSFIDPMIAAQFNGSTQNFMEQGSIDPMLNPLLNASAPLADLTASGPWSEQFEKENFPEINWDNNPFAGPYFAAHYPPVN